MMLKANSTWDSQGISELATNQRGVKLIFGNRDGIRSFLHPMAVSENKKKLLFAQ